MTKVTHDQLRADLGERADVDVLVGGWPCFVEGTLVLSDRGLLPIEDVKVGDRVVSHHGRWQQVTGTNRKQAETVLTSGYGHPGLESTPGHGFWTSDGWVQAKELAGHHWSSLVRYPSLPVPPITAEGREHDVPQWSENVAWVAGRFLGDGWAYTDARRGQVYICCAKTETADLAERVAPSGFHATVVTQRTTNRVVISSRPLARWLIANFGSGAEHKTVPAWMFADPHRAAFLDGYVSADGCAAKNGWKATTISKKIAVGIRMVALSLGYSVSLYLNAPAATKVIEGRTVNQRPWFQVQARRTTKPDRRSYTEGIWRFGAVKQVEATSHERTVVDLTVGTDQSFLADGVAVHNCQGLSLAGRRLGLADRRSGLFWEFRRLVDELRPGWVVAENVPGLLSSYTPVDPLPDGVPAGSGDVEVDETSDLGVVLASMAELGWARTPTVKTMKPEGLASESLMPESGCSL